MIRIPIIILALATSIFAQVEGSTGEDSAHQELRELRSEMLAAIESRDIERMLAYVHPDIVTTWQDGTTTHGVDELRNFYKKLGEDAFVAFKVPHKPDRLAILEGGDTAISTGKVVADYRLLGKNYEFTSRWSASLVLDGDQWKVIAYHVSLNALDNPIISTAKSLLWVAGGIGVLLGLVVGFFVFRRKKQVR